MLENEPPRDLETAEIEPKVLSIPPGGALGYFLGGYVPPGTPNWHPVLKKLSLKLMPRSRNGPIFYTPF